MNIEGNYWKIFDTCYMSKFDAEDMTKFRLELFKIGQEVMNDKIVGESLTRKYLYGYF